MITQRVHRCPAPRAAQVATQRNAEAPPEQRLPLGRGEHGKMGSVVESDRRSEPGAPERARGERTEAGQAVTDARLPELT